MKLLLFSLMFVCGIAQAELTNTDKVNTFISRPNYDTRVIVEQIGSSNTTEINQSGSYNNHVNYYTTGSSNNVTVNQSTNNSGQINYVDLTIYGNSNTVDLTQRTTSQTNSFGKGIFASIADNNNILNVTQKDGGSHYADITLSGGGKNVDVTQQGSAGHTARVGLTGLSTDLSLTQSGSTQQSYSINFNCAIAGGCPKITVTQGQ